MTALNLDLPAGSRIVVAMSGGVDSSVAAAMVAQAGYEVIGVTLQLYDHGSAVGKKGACCAGQDIRDAKRVADHMGFPHYVLDFEKIFKEKVIDDFAENYKAGSTPLPCVRCNQRIKFDELLHVAKDLGADALATGHYIRRAVTAHGPQLARAHDAHRDQSYFLFATTRDQLDYLRFPLGDMAKTEVRKKAEELGLLVADKPDSQDLCFVPKGHYSNLVAKLHPAAKLPGDIVNLQGDVLGQHEGIIHYTVGQRRGIGVAAADPYYVLRLDATRRQVIIGLRHEGGCVRADLKDVVWNGPALAPHAEIPVMIKHRAHAPAIAGHAVADSSGQISHASFTDPQFGIARGQACVFYQNDHVCGGGWITHAPLLVDETHAEDHDKNALSDLAMNA